MPLESEVKSMQRIIRDKINAFDKMADNTIFKHSVKKKYIVFISELNHFF